MIPSLICHHTAQVCALDPVTKAWQAPLWGQITGLVKVPLVQWTQFSRHTVCSLSLATKSLVAHW